VEVLRPSAEPQPGPARVSRLRRDSRRPPSRSSSAGDAARVLVCAQAQHQEGFPARA